jgi:hypothetical protein
MQKATQNLSNLMIAIPSVMSSLLKEDFAEVKARLVYLETLQCRNLMTKEQIDEERKIATQKFKLILTLTE